MSQEFRAIYEHGVLRPLTPLSLPESAEVTGVLHQENGAVQKTAAADPLLGLMADEPDLMDDVAEDALSARESHLFRAEC